MNKKIKREELRKFNNSYDWYNEHGDGYRIVYFYEDDKYKIGSISKNIDGFFTDIKDISDDYNKFDIDYLLDSYINDLIEIDGVAIYKTTGELVKRKNKIKIDYKIQGYIIDLIVKIFNNQITKEDIEKIDIHNDNLIYYLSKIDTKVFEKNLVLKEKIKKVKGIDNIKLVLDIELAKKYLPQCYQLIRYVKLPSNDKELKELVYLNEKVLYLLPDKIKDMFFIYDVLKNNYKVSLVIDHFDENNKKYYFLNNDLYNMYIDGLVKLIKDDIKNYELLSDEAKQNIKLKITLNELTGGEHGEENFRRF